MASKKRKTAASSGGFIRSVSLMRDDVPSFDAYPFSIPAVASLNELPLDPHITFFVGENGSGKSSLIEAIAQAAGFNAEGGTKNFQFSTKRTESDLVNFLRLVRNPHREQDGFFLRAESLFNAATYLDTMPDVLGAYGGRSLHAQSHGESFLALAKHRFRAGGLFLLDEPEAALSPSRQLAFLAILHALISQGSQFIVATHSPILLSYPEATIYLLDEGGIREISYEESEHYQITRDFLNSRDLFLRHLFSGQPESDERDS